MDTQPKVKSSLSTEELDVVIVVDSTGSMDPFLIALTRLLPQLLAIRALTTSPSTSGISDILSPHQLHQPLKRIRRIGILTYKDYYPVLSQLYPNQISSIVHPIPTNDQAAAALQPKLTIEDVLTWSGWDDPLHPLHLQTAGSSNPPKDNVSAETETEKQEAQTKGLDSQYLSEWVKGITAEGGGDYPEAAKTALRRLLDLVIADIKSKLPSQEETTDQSQQPPQSGQTAQLDPSEESTEKQQLEIVETIVLWYTDAPPHHRSHRGINRALEIGAHGCVPAESGWVFQSDNPSSPPTIPTTSASTPVPSAAPAPAPSSTPAPAPDSNDSTQNQDKLHPPQQLPPTVSMRPYLGKVNLPTPLPPAVPRSKCLDWVHLTKVSKKVGLRVYTIVPPSMPDIDASFYALLGAVTDGGVFVVGGKESKKKQKIEADGDNVEKGKEKDNEEEDGDGSGWYNELMISGGAPFVKAVTTLSLEIVLALVGLEDPDSRIPDPDEDAQMTDEPQDDLSTEMSISEPSDSGAGRGRGFRGGYRGAPSSRGYWRGGHYYPGRGQRRRRYRPFRLRDPDGDEQELKEMLMEEKLAEKDVPVQWLSFEEDVVSYMKGRPEPPALSKPSAPAAEPALATGANTVPVPNDKKTQPIPEPEPKPEPQPRIQRIYHEESSVGFLPYEWRAPMSSRTKLYKRISRENVEGVELTKRIVGFGKKWSSRDRGAQKENEDEKDKEEGETPMETSIYIERNSALLETTTFLLKRVVDMDVEAIPRVWLFDEIWRAISKQPSNDLQQSLFALFSERVDSIKKEELRQRLKNWAAINHDASAEITKLLEQTSIKEENLVLSLDEGAVDQSGLRKEDILELTRSCDKKLLKKMGYLLRYTKVIPASAVIAGNQSQISLSVAAPETVFRVLPHLAFEGVMYTPRTAAILATVALTSHIPHLLKPAHLLLESTKGSWLNALTPENFTPAFVHFVLSLPSTSIASMLSSEEKGVYEGMNKYTVLEENLDTKLQGLVPWTPMKTRGVGDRKRVCEGCGIRRSETMMHQVGSQIKKRRYMGLEGKKEDTLEEVSGMRCGMCVDSDTKNPQDWKDQGEIQSCWVECSERWCRAQYVIEDEEGLRIPPRCYYCRKRRPCPWIECTKCGNRIILPKSYRDLPADSPSNFTCPPCQNQSFTGHKTIVHKLTTLRSILFANEYEVEWLGVKPFKEIFRGRSTFMIWEIYGGGIFGAVTPSSSPLGTPPTSSPPISPVSASGKRDTDIKDKKKRLELYGKRLLNPSALREELNGIVDKAMRKGHVLCGLTYEFVREEELVKACDNARKVEDGGCTFVASVDGLREWYSGGGERRKQCPACRGPGKVV